MYSLITQGGYSFSLGDLIIATFFGSAHTLYVEWTALCISFLLILIISSSDTNEHFSIQRMMRFEKKTRFWIYSYINIIVSSLFLIAVYIMTYVVLLICTGNSLTIATLNVNIFINHTTHNPRSISPSRHLLSWSLILFLYLQSNETLYSQFTSCITKRSTTSFRRVFS